jgi:hypothetical protein
VWQNLTMFSRLVSDSWAQGNLPTSVSWVAGTTGTWHCTQLERPFAKNVFHFLEDFQAHNCSDTCTVSPTISNPHQSGVFSTNEEFRLTHHYHPKTIVYISCLFSLFIFLLHYLKFLLVLINCTKRFHCDISILAYNVKFRVNDQIHPSLFIYDV